VYWVDSQKERLFTGDPRNVVDVAVDVVKEHYEIEAVDREDMDRVFPKRSTCRPYMLSAFSMC